METDFIEKIFRDVQNYAKKRHGKIYAPIMHPQFSCFESVHGHERFNLISKYIPTTAKTVLDIGSHWGYFSHRFEDLGFEVTAVENNQEYLYFLRAIREICNKKFKIWDQSIFKINNFDFDIVLALNIFHHFTKDKSTFLHFQNFLCKLNCHYLFFQAHNPKEGQMRNSYINFKPDKFVFFLMEKLRMNNFNMIGAMGSRMIYLIEK